jgi:hypothetical protein
MKDALKEKEQLLSSKDAGKLLGYTHDYISKLCREGKMNGVQKGRAWYVTEKETLAFKKRHEAELDQKKAQLSQKFSELRLQHESKRLEEPTLETAIVEKTHIPFVIPRQFVAVAVLAFVLLIPSFVRSISEKTNTNQFASVNTVHDMSSITEYFDAGVATVISAQSELVPKTISTYSFVQNLNDGYWQIAFNTIELSKGFYYFLETISDGYLTFYLMQGQMIYASMVQTSNMGLVVLSGYELMGQSLVVGGGNVVSSYRTALNLDSGLESGKKKLSNFSQNTSEGLEYAQAQVGDTILTSIAKELRNSTQTVIQNVNLNFSAVSRTVKSTSEIVKASVIDIFSFDFLKHRDEPRKVE